MTDITATIVFHAEGALVRPALASLRDMVDIARGAGIVVEARAILDRPDALTRHLVALQGDWLDGVTEVAFGDLGLTRNAAAEAAVGRHLAFLDGDDLWGADWLRLAHAAATAPDAPHEAIWHPEQLFCFSEGDFDRTADGPVPKAHVQACFRTHEASTAPDFDRDLLFLSNVWSANAFAARSLHLRHPYAAVDRGHGFGIEDWTWNIETLWSGIPHLIVPKAVHLIRLKDSGSLNVRNLAEGLLPFLPDDVRPRCATARGFRTDRPSCPGDAVQ
jgi:hypothetical protein